MREGKSSSLFIGLDWLRWMFPVESKSHTDVNENQETMAVINMSLIHCNVVVDIVLSTQGLNESLAWA